MKIGNLMKFKTIENFKRLSGVSTAYLIWDSWNDFNFLTTFGLIYVDENSVQHKIGTVKIGSFGQKKLERPLEKGISFNALDEKFFSLGQSDTYYDNLNSLGSLIRDSILIG
jgi:hypothetical protein